MDITTIDIENYNDKMTPYCVAMLRENYELAQVLEISGLCDKYYLNTKGENVYEIAKKLGLRKVQKHIINETSPHKHKHDSEN